MKKVFWTTLVGGALFLIPLVFLTWVLTKGFQIMIAILGPIAPLIPVDSVAGIGAISLLAIVLMLTVCLLTGVLARAKMARSFYRKSDGMIGALVPSYIWTKVVLKSLSGRDESEESSEFKPVLVKLDDQTQIAFEMERGDGEMVVVFFPGAPDIQSGTVGFVEAARIEPLDTSLLVVNNILRQMGKGAAALLKQ